MAVFRSKISIIFTKSLKYSDICNLLCKNVVFLYKYLLNFLIFPRKDITYGASIVKGVFEYDV